MAYRVVPSEVRDIIDTSITDPSIESYILAANLYVTAKLGESTLLAAQLKEIERWLTAHFIACSRERQVREEVVGEARVSYMAEYSMVGLGLDVTFYGQQVKLLDTTGTLAADVPAKSDAFIYAITSFD